MIINTRFDTHDANREIYAVHSENLNYGTYPDRRLGRLLDTFVNTSHPCSKDPIGSLKTLKDAADIFGLNLRDELLRFHEKYFSSNMMTTVILGKENLDDLQAMAVSLLSNVTNRNTRRPKFPGNPRMKPFTGYAIKQESIHDAKELTIIFGLPRYPCDKSYIGTYIGNLINSDDDTDLKTYMKDNGLIESIKSELHVEGPAEYESFRIVFGLTTMGVGRVDEILEILFQYITSLKKYPRFSEALNIPANGFYKKDPCSYVESISMDSSICVNLTGIFMIDYPQQRVLKIDEYLDFLSHLNETNFNYVITMPNFEGTSSGGITNVDMRNNFWFLMFLD